MATLEIKNLEKKFKQTEVLKGINLEIDDGDFLVLLGPSGCGKSTLLNTIAGLENSDNGEVIIDSKKVNDMEPSERDIAFVFQSYALYPAMNVKENITFGLKQRKISKEKIDQSLNKIVELLKITELLQRKPAQLSGGQRQRVAMGRAIVRKPKVFLFDEPLSNLDAKFRVQMRTEISKLHHRLEATMIYVTHDQTEAMTMGDRIVVMKDGIVQQIDTPLNLYNFPVNKFVAGFIGSPAMNFIEGKIIQENGLKFVSEKGELIFSISNNIENLRNYINKKIIAGIRPEEFQPAENQNAKENVNVFVEVVEPMGNESFIYFLIDEIQFVARVSSIVQVRPEQNFQFSFDPSRVHFFDFETEKRIN